MILLVESKHFDETKDKAKERVQENAEKAKHVGKYKANRFNAIGCTSKKAHNAGSNMASLSGTSKENTMVQVSLGNC